MYHECLICREVYFTKWKRVMGIMKSEDTVALNAMFSSVYCCWFCISAVVMGEWHVHVASLLGVMEHE